MRAEFKSGADPTGGDDINKFVGSLDAERRRSDPSSISGYFVSLSGFTATALAQEQDFDNARVILMDGRRVLRDLIDGGIVVPYDVAVGTAQQTVDDGKVVLATSDPLLIGHHSGWSWAVPFERDGEVISICMIYADGSPLDVAFANDIYALGQNSIDGWQNARIANKRTRVSRSFRVTRRRYTDFIKQEYGGITLEGLPADQSVGSSQFKLESLFVPLTLSPLTSSAESEARLEGRKDVFDSPPVEDQASNHRTVSETLARHLQIAILGLPGSGKTTLLKRLAVAYADPERLAEVDDDLPRTGWLPVVIKCRKLTPGTRTPVIEMMANQAVLAEMPELKDDFQDLISHELHNGNLLLLIDGLDEISEPTDRAEFVSQLRTFIGVYPTCHLVVTSREAGFRSVAAAVGSICQSYSVDDLSDGAIQTLVAHWHSEVIGKTKEIRRKADQLAKSIIRTERVRALAVNPLLLTTLLLVQRWMGELPRRRSVLYDKAIEVLLMTWNIEGHDPLDKDEVLPQLAYVAFTMMTDGKKTITSDELLVILQTARNDMPETLSYSRMSTHEFVLRVEERSSIMTLSGHELVSGKVKPTYEFKHLTFQEYLAATAIVEGWLPAQQRDLGIVQILRPYVSRQGWQEVVTLVAVLSGRKASELVEEIAERLSSELEANAEPGDAMEQLYRNLVGCLRDESLLAPDRAYRAIELTICAADVVPDPYEAAVDALYGGKFDSIARDALHNNLTMKNSYLFSFVGTLGTFGFKDFLAQADVSEIDDWILAHLDEPNKGAVIYGAGTLMHAAWDVKYGDTLDPDKVDLTRSTGAVVRRLVDRPIRRDVETFAYLWALSWAMPTFAKSRPRLVNDLQLKLLEIWRGSRNRLISRVAAWALSSTPFVGRWHFDANHRDELIRFADSQLSRVRRKNDMLAKGARVIQRYATAPSEAKFLVEQIVADREPFGIEEDFTLRLLDSLGPAGKAAARKELEQDARKTGRRARVFGVS
ncbi:NACHT domain-containing protein [Mycobacterium sp. MMS18-G62]